MVLTSHFQHLYETANYTTFTKDAFHRYIIHDEKDAVNPKKKGTKVAPYYVLIVGADEERVLRCRLMAEDEIVKDPFAERNFGAIIQKRLKEADEFYHVAIPCKYFFFIIKLQWNPINRVSNGALKFGRITGNWVAVFKWGKVKFHDWSKLSKVLTEISQLHF